MTEQKTVTVNFFMDDTDGVAIDVVVDVQVQEQRGDGHSAPVSETFVRGNISKAQIDAAIQKLKEYLENDVVEFAEDQVTQNL